MHPLKQINQNYRLQPMNFLTRFYRISSPVPRRQLDPAQEQKLYKRLRLQAFIAATLGYSLYYVCRTSLNVMKKPILDSGTLDATQIGVISSALLFAYAVGKFVNGFIADYCNRSEEHTSELQSP